MAAAAETLPISDDILVIDDESDIRDSVSTLLQALGYRVRESANGREAVDAIEHARPWLILLDLMMPVMDGFEFLEWANRTRKLSQDSVVVMSAAANLCPPGFRLLRKPFDIHDLLAAIRDRNRE